MPLTAERQAPPAADEPISDARLRELVNGADDEPDEIVYRHARGTFFTSRAERERAARIWQEEGQVPYPDNAAQSLARTEAMLRFRLRDLDSHEGKIAVRDLVTLHRDHLPMPQLDTHPHAEPTEPPAEPDWLHSQTGEFNAEAEQHVGTDIAVPKATPEEPAHAETQPRRRRGMRVPLHRLVKHVHRMNYKPRHAQR